MSFRKSFDKSAIDFALYRAEKVAGPGPGPSPVVIPNLIEAIGVIAISPSTDVTTLLATVAPGYYLSATQIVLTEGFNGASPTFSVGTSLDPSLIFSNVSLASPLNLGDVFPHVFSIHDNLILTVHSNGSTLGAGFLRIALERP